MGLDDDTAKWRSRSDGLLATYRHLGIEPSAHDPVAEGPEPADHGSRHLPPSRRGDGRPWQRVVLAVYGEPQQAPLENVQRGHYCGFLKHVLARIPKIRDVVVWNEVNSPDFCGRGGAIAYEALLAECWDRLRRLRPTVNLISSTAARHDPAGFMSAPESRTGRAAAAARSSARSATTRTP